MVNKEVVRNEEFEKYLEENFDINSIPEDVFSTCVKLIEHHKFKYYFEFEENKIIMFANFKNNYCRDDYYSYLNEQLSNESDFVCNILTDQYIKYTSYYNNLKNVCYKCGQSVCFADATAFLAYIKSTELIDKYLQLRNNPITFFNFKWAPKNGLKEVPEYIYQAALRIVNSNKMHVDRNLNDHGDVCVRVNYYCSDMRSITKEEPFFDVCPRAENDRSAVCFKCNDDLFNISRCDKTVCLKEYCPIGVAGYIYYLRKMKLDCIIYQDREYYKANETDILKSVNEKYKKEVYENQYKYKKQIDEMFKYFNEDVSNFDLFTDMISNSFNKDFGVILEKEDGINIGRFIGAIKKSLEIQNKIQSFNKVVQTSLSEFASTLVLFHDSTDSYGGIEFPKIEQHNLFIFDKIKDFVKLYYTFSELKIDSTYNIIKKKQLEEAINFLFTSKQNKYIILVGNKEEIDSLLELDPKLNFRFKDFRFNINSFSKEDLFEIYVDNLNPDLYKKAKDNYEEIKDKFINFLNQNKDAIPFKPAEVIVLLSSYSNIKNDLVFPPDIRETENLESIFKDIVGLDEIKNKIKEMENYMIFANKAKALNLKVPDSNLHMIFTGGPGTGKTMIARTIAKMLFDVSAIKENKLIEVERKDLIAKYIGHTALKTSEIIEKAMGGVLFIDEAYSLSVDSKNDFGPEAIATIIKAMEDNKKNLVIIFAGYKDKMKDFIESNPGISSRIGYAFDFSDYSDEELLEIFNVKIKQTGFTTNNKCQENVMKLIKYFNGMENIGNGRFIDKIIQETLIKKANNNSNNIKLISGKDVPSINEMIEIISKQEDLINPDKITKNAIRNTAIHEIGHAFIKYKLFNSPDIKRITINANGSGILGRVEYDKSYKYTRTKTELLNIIKTALGGMASEFVFNGEYENGNSSDIEKATNIAKEMITKYGMSELGLAQIHDTSGEMNKVVQDELNKILKECYDAAVNIIKENREQINKLVDFLLKNKEITGEQFIREIKDK